MATPEGVRQAQREGNYRLLSKMGRKGAETVAVRKAIHEAEADADLLERIAEIERVEHVTSEGDVLPPEPGLYIDPDEQQTRH